MLMENWHEISLSGLPRTGSVPILFCLSVNNETFELGRGQSKTLTSYLH